MWRSSFTTLTFTMPDWIPPLSTPTHQFNSDPPTYARLTSIIRKMKSNSSACPLDQLSIISLKHSAYLRTYLTAIIQNVWKSGQIPEVWKKAVTILIHKKDSPDDPQNFRPITLQSVPLKIFMSALRNTMYEFLLKNGFIENSIQKGFTPGMSGTFEHTSHLAFLIKQAKKQQRSLTVTLLDLKNAFGEVHHRLIPTVLQYHHIPEHFRKCVENVYSDFYSSVITDAYQTPFIKVNRGVLQGCCFSPLLFNMLMNTYVQYIKSERFIQLGFTASQPLLKPKHWFQFADDAAITTGEEYETQILLNAFTAWCSWAKMKLRIDKCKSFGVSKVNSTSSQILPKLYLNRRLIPSVNRNESFCYLGRYYNFAMDNTDHKQILISETEDILEKIDRLPLHPKFKLQLYMKYLLPKISWHLTIADIDKTWVKQTLDMICHNKFRAWLEIPPCGTLDILFLSKSKFGLNIVDISTKFTQSQVVLRNKLKNSSCPDIRQVYEASSTNTNVQYDRYLKPKEVIREIRAEKVENIQNHLTSQSLVTKSLWKEAFPDMIKDWHATLDKLSKNIYNFVTRYLNNTLPTLKNMLLWNKATSNLCYSCSNVQTLQHIVSSCKVHLEQGRYTWRHNSVLKNLVEYLSSVKKDLSFYADVDGFENPSIIAGLEVRPDMIIVNTTIRAIYVIELTIGFETNITKNCTRKTLHYKEFCNALKQRYDTVE